MKINIRHVPKKQCVFGYLSMAELFTSSNSLFMKGYDKNNLYLVNLETGEVILQRNLDLCVTPVDGELTYIKEV